jgi:hypothetical protein
MNKFIKKYNRSLLYIIILIVILIAVIAIGFPLGFLSEDPDGLERVLIDSQGEPWLENLEAFWYPILSWIENEYVAGIIGILLTLIIALCIFNLVKFIKNRKAKVDILPVSK